MDTGGKIRTGKILEQLAKINEITLISNVESPKDSPYLSEIQTLCTRFIPVSWKEIKKYSPLFFMRLFFQMFSLFPVSVLNDHSRALQLAVEDAHEKEKYDLVVCDFIQSALNFKNIGGTPSILFQHNVESQVCKRHFEGARGVISKLFWWLQWKKLFYFEKWICSKFTTVIAVSKQDRATFQSLYGLENVAEIPTGVDIDYYTPRAEKIEANTLVFVGSMDWLPNEDAVIFFIHDILPSIKKTIPDIVLKVVGRNPSPRLKRILTRVSEVQLTGWVKDVRPYIAKAALYIVPIRIGGGTRMKIYEAMAMGKAILSTSIGAEGLSVKDGENIILKDGASGFSQEIISLLGQEERRKMIGQNASDFVRGNCTWPHVGEVFQEICTRTAFPQTMYSRET